MADTSTTGQQSADVTAYSAHLRRMLAFRRQYDSRRALFFRQYIGQREARMFPDNLTRRSNTFIPYPLSNVETIVSRTMDAYFSQDPWFEVLGKGSQDEPMSESMFLAENHMLNKANLQQNIETLVRSVCIYGHDAIKVEWDWGYDTVLDPQPILQMAEVVDPQSGQKMQVPVPDPNTGQPIVLGLQPTFRQVPRMCPKFTPIDVYDLLIDPDGGMAACLTEKTVGQLLRENEGYALVRPGEYLYDPAALQRIQSVISREKSVDDVLVRIAEIWDGNTGMCAILTFNDDREAISWKDLRTSYRNANTSSFKRTLYGGPVELLWAGPNPFGHKKIPILHTSYIKVPGEVYGLGAIEVISDLTEAMNVFVNMIVDNWNLGINRRYAYNVDADIDHAALNNFNVPGGKVGGVGDPNKFIAPLPFFTPQRGDYAILDVYKGMIETTSGISDFYSKGMGSPTGNRTATGISSVINESNFRFRSFIGNLERDIFKPLLQMVASMIQQYVTDPVEIQITDAPPGIAKWPLVHPDELLGNFNFEFAAANYSSNKVLKQRNLLAFANWAAQTPFWNQYEGLKEIAKAFEVRRVQRLLLTPEQVAANQQAQLAQQVQLMIFEAMLNTESKARLGQSKPITTKTKEGRPRTSQPEGPFPGAGLSSAIRGAAQAMGANTFGLDGLGEVNDG